MTPDDTGRAYNTITHLWTSPKFNVNNGVDAHKRAIAFTKGEGFALDVGCGATGRFIELLQTSGFAVEGVDVSSEMLALSREKFPTVDFYQQDICEWPLPRQYDLMTAWDSIWHVPLAQQKALMKKLFNGLSANGVCIFSCGAVDEAGDHTDATMGPDMYYATLGIAGFLAVIESCGCALRHFEYDQHPELHGYFIVQKL